MHLLTFLALVFGIARGGSGPTPSERVATIPGEEVAASATLPHALARDENRLYGFTPHVGQVVRADLDAEKVSFRELPGTPLPQSIAFAAREGLVCVARRSPDMVIVLDGEGRRTSSFTTPGPPSAIAIDPRGGIHVFSIKLSEAALDSLVTVFNTDGDVLRHGGTVPHFAESDTLFARRAAAMPLLRTDAHGDVWALLHGGESAIRMSTTRARQDVVDLRSVERPPVDAFYRVPTAPPGPIDPTLPAPATRPTSPGAIRVPPPAYSDFACGARECVAVQTRPLDASTLRLVIFDAKGRVESRDVELEGNPKYVAGILYAEGEYALYAPLGDRLMRYRLTRI